MLVTDVGQPQMWAAQHYFFDKPTRTSPPGAGADGLRLPAPIGVQFGLPERAVWCDHRRRRLPDDPGGAGGDRGGAPAVKIALFNNGYLGMVRQWQQLFFEKRYIAVKMWNPDYVKLGEAYGIPTVRAWRRRRWQAGAERRAGSRARHDRVRRRPYENVWPMVPPGASLQETIEAWRTWPPPQTAKTAVGGGSSGGV